VSYEAVQQAVMSISTSEDNCISSAAGFYSNRGVQMEHYRPGCLSQVLQSDSTDASCSFPTHERDSKSAPSLVLHFDDQRCENDIALCRVYPYFEMQTHADARDCRALNTRR
jgi:hypothetical protein